MSEKPRYCKTCGGPIGHHTPVMAGYDYNGLMWFWDPEYQRIFLGGDPTPSDQRGYDCDSLYQASMMLIENEVP